MMNTSYLTVCVLLTLGGVAAFSGVGGSTRQAIAGAATGSHPAVGQSWQAAETEGEGPRLSSADIASTSTASASTASASTASASTASTSTASPGPARLKQTWSPSKEERVRVQDIAATDEQSPRGFTERVASGLGSAWRDLPETTLTIASTFWGRSGLDSVANNLFEGAFANTIGNWTQGSRNALDWIGGLASDSVDFVWDRTGLDSLVGSLAEHTFWRTRGQEGGASLVERISDFGADLVMAPSTVAANFLYDVIWQDAVGGLLYGALSFTSPDSDDRQWAIPKGASDALFIDGVSPDDIDQGDLGDCIYLAGIAAVAVQNPERIEDLIVDNGDGTYTVTLHTERPPGFFWEPRWTTSEITVTAEVPVDEWGRSLYVGSPSGELWPFILEKAMAEHRGGYHRMNGSFSSKYALEALTGNTSNAGGYLIDAWVGTFGPSYTLPDPATMADLLDEGYAITANAKPGFAVTDAIPSGNHAYYVRSVDLDNETIDIGNPWGERYDLTLTFEEFEDNFSGGTYVSSR